MNMFRQRPMDSRARLLQAMAGRKGVAAKDARYASLPALPPYAETRTSDGQTGGRSRNDFGAFADDAFQNDGFQVS
jgi:hypothetical protein